jgi:hypothetical protein
MGKHKRLRMKETPEERAERKARGKRRHATPLDDDEPRPARTHKSSSYVFDFDESAGPAPPLPSATKPDLDDFNQRLFEAMREDEGGDAWDGFYASTMPSRWRDSSGGAYSYSTSKVVSDTVASTSGAVLNFVVFKDAMDEEVGGAAFGSSDYPFRY